VVERLAMTAEVLRTRTSAEWLARLDRENVPCAPVLDREQVIAQEQVRVNEVIEELEHPLAGRYRQPRPAARFSETPARIRGHAPLLGEHSAEIALELGVSGAELETLLAKKVLGAPPK
jgi:crotonobetainyl-CoA:carnitine CoA-transferase CaiB-like acyl-CoA transferase